ncbi:MAG: catalase [Kiritimatiellae bacterium]|nr:catalase [Kiritimatiellia bacterium]
MEPVSNHIANAAIGGCHLRWLPRIGMRVATPAAGGGSRPNFSSVFFQPAVTVRLDCAGEEEESPGAYSAAAITDPRTTRRSTMTGLDPQEEEMLRELRARDHKVRQHEQRHAAVLGRYARGIRYTYQVGPDGRPYAVGGSVEVDTSSEPTPEATAEKARVLKRAALAAGDASPADLAVAAAAGRMEARANSRLLAQA